jgi:hypothetical protein
MWLLAVKLSTALKYNVIRLRNIVHVGGHVCQGCFTTAYETNV